MNTILQNQSNNDLDSYIQLLNQSHNDKFFYFNQLVFDCDFEKIEFIYSLNRQFKIDFSSNNNLILTTCLLSPNSPSFNLDNQLKILELLLNSIELNPLDCSHNDCFLGPIGSALSINHNHVCNTILSYYNNIQNFPELIKLIKPSIHFLELNYQQPLDNLTSLIQHKSFNTLNLELNSIKNLYSTYNKNIPKNLYMTQFINLNKSKKKSNNNPFLPKFKQKEFLAN